MADLRAIGRLSTAELERRVRWGERQVRIRSAEMEVVLASSALLGIFDTDRLLEERLQHFAPGALTVLERLRRGHKDLDAAIEEQISEESGPGDGHG